MWPFKRKKKKFYTIGDVAPASLLERNGRNLGAFITVDPDTNVITNIWVP